MLKMSLQMFLILAVVLYGAGLKITMHPFTVGFENKQYAAGIILFVLGFTLIVNSTFQKGKAAATKTDSQIIEKVFNRMATERPRIIKN